MADTRPTLCPPSYPLATAPKVPHAPLLLWDPGYDCWLTGFWDGECWCVMDGIIASPAHWAPLPGRPGAS